MRRIMVDVETLGLGDEVTILSIGAVEFGPDGLGEEFYRSISMESCGEVGLGIEPATLEWWLTQEESAREALVGGEHIEGVLWDFTGFYGDADEVWANSPSADCEWLEDAYEAVGLEEPWEYSDERDYRTFMSLPGEVEVVMEGTEHNALDDAKYQALMASQKLSLYQEAFQHD